MIERAISLGALPDFVVAACERDAQGRIMKFDLDDPTAYRVTATGLRAYFGVAVCQDPRCGREMACSDVICTDCLRPYCHRHVIEVDDGWYCRACAAKIIAAFDAMPPVEGLFRMCSCGMDVPCGGVCPRCGLHDGML